MTWTSTRSRRSGRRGSSSATDGPTHTSTSSGRSGAHPARRRAHRAAGARLTGGPTDPHEPAGWSGPSADELARSAGERWQSLVDSGEVVMFGEPTNEPVVLVDVDGSWAGRFRELQRAIASALGPTAVRIAHVGSTAVPGIVAKPIVDIQVSVPDVGDEDAYVPRLEALGWPMRSREPGHRYFRTPKGVKPRIQVHVCEAGGEWEREHLLFRDYLRAHSEVARQYAELKRDFAARYGDDRLAYTEAKTPFIRSTLARAERWAQETGWVAA